MKKSFNLNASLDLSKNHEPRTREKIFKYFNRSQSEHQVLRFGFDISLGALLSLLENNGKQVENGVETSTLY